MLNFPYFEDYSLEKLEEVQDEENLVYSVEHDGLILITYEGLLYVYVKNDEENPATYFLNPGSSESTFRLKGRFTTHVRSHILTLMGHLKSLMNFLQALAGLTMKIYTRQGIRVSLPKSRGLKITDMNFFQFRSLSIISTRTIARIIVKFRFQQA